MRQLNICRCCLAVGCDKDISKEYEEDGRKEVYSDMLLDTFNIFISYEDVGGKCQICEGCIQRLREAAQFKTQVIEAGKAIAQKLRNPQIEFDVPIDESEESANVKMEVYEEVELACEGLNFDSFVTNDDDDIYIIKLEAKEEDAQEMNALAQNILQRSARDRAHLSERDGRTQGLQRNGRKRRGQKKEKPTKPRPEVTQRHLDMRANSLKLIRNSNMCLFKAGRAKFGCFYCYETYRTMDELREHSKLHSHTKELVIKINPVSGLAYKKADISGLHCTRCLEPCDTIEALQEHLTIIHDFTFTDAGHLLIPFKLEKDFYCALCGLLCNTFAYLSIHMNTHFPNYVCEICGAAYINFKNLDIHRRVIHLRKCKKCINKDRCTCKDDEEIRPHIRANTRMCSECNLVFKYSYLLKEHNYQVHGAPRPIATCNICSKTFLTPNNLKLHIRRIHNVERNHVCKICDMSFFTAHGMRKHINRTHTDVEIKPYSCSYCACKFKMKYSLCKHLKNRHGRRMDGQFFDNIAVRLEEINA